jgi:hypothetical protein
MENSGPDSAFEQHQRRRSDSKEFPHQNSYSELWHYDDEPAFGAAMEICGVEMDSWNISDGNENAMYMENAYSINVLKGKARFRKNGADRDPVLIHFNVDAQDGTTYNREIYRLKFENCCFVLSMSK